MSDSRDHSGFFLTLNFDIISDLNFKPAKTAVSFYPSCKWNQGVNIYAQWAAIYRPIPVPTVMPLRFFLWFRILPQITLELLCQPRLLHRMSLSLCLPPWPCTYGKWHIILLKINFIWGGDREREIPSAVFLPKCLGVRNSTKVSCVSGRDQITWAIKCHLA